jgi:multidrug transporter EmrE-like cation transporter
MTNYILAMMLGIIGTVTIHLAKCFQRQGIHHFKESLQDRSNGDASKRSKTYLMGILLANSAFFFVIIANRLAPPSYYTSMFGFGLIVLMIYSDKILQEPIRVREYLGTTILVIGTVVLGVEGIRNPLEDFSTIRFPRVWMTLGFFILLAGPMLLYSLKRNNHILIGVVFGIITGATASLDPFFKGIGQYMGGSPGFLPSVGHGWFYFMISFLFSTAQFLLTQLGFLRKAHASVLVPIHNCAYIIFPILIQQVAVPDYSITILTGTGLALIVLGVALLHPLDKQKFTVDLM